MSAGVAMSVALRLLTQLRRDLRTVALVIVAPPLLMVLAKYLLDDHPGSFQRIGGPALGLFPFIQMFLITSIAILRERSAGTLERLMSMPLAKLDLLIGYGAAFGLLATFQVSVVSAIAVLVLGLHLAGSFLAVFGLAIGNAMVGVTLGLLFSAFANNEFQASEFMPAFILPQLLVCGLFVPREQMAGWLQVIADLMPLTYAFDALDRVGRGEGLNHVIALDLTVMTVVGVLGLVLSATTLRRRTP
jgi:ABC-2 type transport system permease protein